MFVYCIKSENAHHCNTSLKSNNLDVTCLWFMKCVDKRLFIPPWKFDFWICQNCQKPLETKTNAKEGRAYVNKRPQLNPYTVKVEYDYMCRWIWAVLLIFVWYKDQSNYNLLFMKAVGWENIHHRCSFINDMERVFMYRSRPLAPEWHVHTHTNTHVLPGR